MVEINTFRQNFFHLWWPVLHYVWVYVAQQIQYIISGKCMLCIWKQVCNRVMVLVTHLYHCKLLKQTHKERLTWRNLMVNTCHGFPWGSGWWGDSQQKSLQFTKWKYINILITADTGIFSLVLYSIVPVVCIIMIT